MRIASFAFAYLEYFHEETLHCRGRLCLLGHIVLQTVDQKSMVVLTSSVIYQNVCMYVKNPVDDIMAAEYGP